MERRRHQTSKDYAGADSELDDLVHRIRRLVLHRGFSRADIESPLLKRLTPSRDEFGGFAEAFTRKKIADAALDERTLAYLVQSVETELDSARLRLT